MKTRRIENMSDHDINIIHEDGTTKKLGPGGVVTDENVKNIDEIRQDASVVFDLTEVMDR